MPGLWLYSPYRQASIRLPAPPKKKAFVLNLLMSSASGFSNLVAASGYWNWSYVLRQNEIKPKMLPLWVHGCNAKYIGSLYTVYCNYQWCEEYQLIFGRFLGTDCPMDGTDFISYDLRAELRRWRWYKDMYRKPLICALPAVLEIIVIQS